MQHSRYTLLLTYGLIARVVRVHLTEGRRLFASLVLLLFVGLQMLPQVSLSSEQLPAMLAWKPTRFSGGISALGGVWHARLVPAAVGSQVRWAVEYLGNLCECWNVVAKSFHP